MNVKEFFGKLFSRYLLFHLLAMFLVVVALCFGVMWGLNVYTHHGEGIELPDLTGMDFDKAERILAEKGLLIIASDTSYNKTMPSDCVLTQVPNAGTKVKEGRTIFVTVNSSSQPLVKIPDLIDNSSYREAQARLTALGFKMLEPHRIDGERDWVYGIRYQGRELASGDKVPCESELMLVIGNGTAESDEEENMMLDAPEADEVDEFEEID